MNVTDAKISSEFQRDPIDDYLECVTYCSIGSFAEESECQTICMERHLQTNYFWNDIYKPIDAYSLILGIFFILIIIETSIEII